MNLRPVRDGQDPAYPALDEVNAARRGFLQKLGLLAGVALTGALASGCDQEEPAKIPEPQREVTPSPPGSPPVPDATHELAPPKEIEAPIEEPPDQQTLGGLRAPEPQDAPELDEAEAPIERIKGGVRAPAKR